jgi:hypothetical protein
MRHALFALAALAAACRPGPPEEKAPVDTADTPETETPDTDTPDTDTPDTDTPDTPDTDTPAVPLPCGEEVCDGAAQYCEVSLPGEPPDTASPPPDNTACMSLPPACADDRTCACLEAAGTLEGFGECRGDAATGLTVTFAYP